MRSLFCFVALTSCLCRQAFAEEPARAFLDGLRTRGFHDVAMAYLDQMQSSRLAPAELKATILYEKSLLLIDSSRKQRDPAVRAQQLNQAQAWLEQFIQTQSDSPKLNAARSRLGSLIVERARMKYEESKKENKQQLIKESRKLYDQSFKVFADLQANVDQQLSKIPKVLNTRDRKEAELIERRKQLRADFLQTELLAAAIREEVADILPAGSSEQNKYLIEAADMYDGIYKDYRTRLAGRYARMYQGRCYQRLGRNKEALGYFGELLDQPNEPEALMLLKAKTLVMAMEAWLSPGQRKYMEAIKQATRWLDETPAEKEREAAWIAIRFHLARALKMQADDAKNSQPVDRALIKQSLEAAKRELRLVASESGEQQEAAQQLLTQLGGPNVVQEDAEPDSFMAAQAVGKEALDAIGPATKQIQTIQVQLAAQQDAEKKEALDTQLLAAEEQLAGVQNDAIHYYRLALELADEQTPQSNVNLVQYFLCYVHFIKQDYFDAALVGDFVARRYPDSPGARQCAKIALACYLKLSEQNEEADKTFEIQRLDSVGKYIADTWPDDAETPNTIATIIPHLINAGAANRAADFVRRLPEDSPSRGEYELVTGQAIWGAFRELQQQADSKGQNGTADESKLAEIENELERLKAEAKELLQAGYDRLPDEPVVDQSSATALLSLAQVDVEDQEFDQAIEVLEHPSLGPLTLVNEKSVAASNPLFIEETYRTALRAYVASLGTAGPEMMEKAKGVIAAMQDALGEDAAGKQRMLGVYVNLAQDVQRRMESATPETRLQLSGVFEAFLVELSGGSSDLSVLHWVADTFASLAAGFDDGDTLNENARKYYQLAEDAFQKVLNQPGITPELTMQIKTHLADVRFHQGEFEPALKLYEEVLSREPKAINVQVAAAELLQAWGTQDATRYQQAINGIQQPGGKPAVWGWAKIALGTVQHSKFRETFYRARYEMATCQLLLASSKTGGEKASLLDDALRNLSRTAKLYPEMGGWKEKYDTLLKQIQTAKGK